MPEESSNIIATRILGASLAALSLLGFAALGSAAFGASAAGPASPLSSCGAFLIGAFAWASPFIPLWLAGAAFVAFLPGFRPGALAALLGSVLPFVPLAAMARLSVQGESALAAYPALEAAGLPAVLAASSALALALSAFVLYFARTLSRVAAEPAEPPAPRLSLPPPRASASSSRGPGASIQLPSLPPLPPFRSLDEAEARAEAVPAPLAAADPAATASLAEPRSAAALAAAPAAAPKALLRDAVPPASAPPIAASPAAAQAGEGAEVPASPLSPVSAPKAAEASAESVVEMRNGGEIEFTSVKPERLQDASGPASQSAAEAERAAAVAAALERVRARRKDKPYAVPTDGILTSYPDGEYWVIDDKTRRSAEVLRETLAEFKIEAEVTGIRKGPVITMFEILPAPGVKLSKITTLADNIALRLAASSVRIVAPIPGKHAVGIEVPNASRSIVSLRELIEAESFKAAKMEIPVVLGKDIAGEAKFIDLAQTPHLLIAGATGSGKSVCVNAMILSILFRRSPQEVKLLLIDPKIVELKLYNDIPHLLTPVITEPKRAFQALQYCICEMERRYSLLDHAGVRDIKSYNRKIRDKGYAAEKLPYIVVVIDEFADLMATTGKELESTIARLAAMSRAIGIHLVLATQRPSIDVITGLIKANIPSRIAFMVASKFDSRIIIDAVGAEKLLGKGDMLVSTVADSFPDREQGAYVSEEEVEKAVEFVKTLGEPEYIDDEIFIDDEDEEGEPSLFGDEDDDPLFEKALEIVLQQGKASASYIQRRLKIGYNRASRLVELMEDKGIVGPANGSKPRDIVRNPEVLGPRGATSGRSDVAPRADGAKQPSLLADLETVPGQRVTGRDEDEDEDEE